MTAAVSTPLRIAHLLLTHHFAGSERYAVELANAQAAAGHDVTMVLRRAGAEQRPDAIAPRLAPNVRQVVVPDLFAGWHARRALRALSPDVAHGHLSGGCRALRRMRPGRGPLRIATLQYQQGMALYLDVLTAQRSLLGARDAEVQARLTRLNAALSLYQALGGGWEEVP